MWPRPLLGRRRTSEGPKSGVNSNCRQFSERKVNVRSDHSRGSSIPAEGAVSWQMSTNQHAEYCIWRCVQHCVGNYDWRKVHVLFSKIANGFIKIIKFLQENIRFGPLIVSLCLILFYRFVPYKYLLFLIHINHYQDYTETNFSMNWTWQIKINRRGKRKARKNKDNIQVPVSKRIA